MAAFRQRFVLAETIEYDASRQPWITNLTETMMAKGIKTVVYPVKDIAKARALYGRLAGSTPEMDQPYYVQFNLDGQQIGLDPNGHAQGMTGPVNYWAVGDIRKEVAAITEAGGHPKSEIKDVGGGKLVVTLTDPDGNLIGLMQERTR